MPELKDRITAWKPVAFLIRVSRKIVLPGFDGLPLYDVAVFFIKGINEGFLTSRASAVSFNFFLAIFPTLLFLFTIIPFIPITDFQPTLLGFIRDLIPTSAYETVRETVEDIVTRHHGGLLSLGFILSLYFSTNGVNSLIEGFNSTYHTIETRPWLKQRLISLVLVLIFSFLLVIAIGLMVSGEIVVSILLPESIEKSGFYVLLIGLLRWTVIVAAIFFAISFLYYLAPAKRRHFRFISAGSSMATLMIVLTMLG
ncbi:MAG TPA: YihY/virulence factor BrkB family protein, partial [Bacteroidales bacterium]|nr:YihY/virulence factor BrkB family protein [Bacteroidales bacterium]